MFKVHDLWGIGAAALTLVLVYLVLNNWVGANSLVQTSANSTVSFLKTLQGR